MRRHATTGRRARRTRRPAALPAPRRLVREGLSARRRGPCQDHVRVHPGRPRCRARRAGRGPRRSRAAGRRTPHATRATRAVPTRCTCPTAGTTWSTTRPHLRVPTSKCPEADRAQPPRRRDQPLPAPARGQPRRLVAVGRRGVRRGDAARPPGAPVDRLLGLPLVPRHGPRVLRGRRHRRGHERAVRQHQGRPRGAPRRRRRLHGGHPGHDRLGRLADDGVRSRPTASRSSAAPTSRNGAQGRRRLRRALPGRRRRVAQPARRAADAGRRS